ncbi:MAG TPA: LPS assembly lipoprotein LptE [Thermoanaerobaculia bacterium]|nr:LPS assembly lipoprotein LptE [Thermoanaerobaculia bacterium]
MERRTEKPRQLGAWRRQGPGVAALLALLLLAGCGYALVGRATNIPADVEEIYVRPLVNATPRSQVDQFLTRAIADELVTRQHLRVGSSEEGADAELSGTVTGFAVTPVAFDADGRATEYEISITASMSFKRLDEAETVLWANDRYIFRQSYEVDLSSAEYIDREDLALQETAERFAETLVTDLLEGF